MTTYANLTLFSNGGLNSIQSNQFQCDNNAWNDLCLYLTIFNGACSGRETINITLWVYEINNDPDPFATFSVKNSNGTWDFISLAWDIDGYFVIYTGGIVGGPFASPLCRSNKLNNIDDIFTIWDQSFSEAADNRASLGGGSDSNWYVILHVYTIY